MNQVELLAPAGNFEALKGVIKAGADAVYLGGKLYSARAYADNFTQEEICKGIRIAHVLGRKVYLTVNTLVKEKELDGLYEYMLPFYEEGLDGVIVQDLGVLRFLRTYFPGLSLHASTQMAITGSGGAGFIKTEGVTRVVPARELSLAEIQRIKEETGLEIEAFVHGAMCYCYSGQCLLSSILGGRSGNRGRCAQPCRLPYEAEGKKGYPLSMKDMCTIEILPKLIEAGIDSFKIEGRMKKPAYAAGVTAIYRKYIDLYYQEKENYRVSKEDMDVLKTLYIRSGTGDGYYKRHNGREMISFDSPAYRETAQGLLGEIEEKYIKAELSEEVKAKVYLTPQKEAELTLEKGDTCITVTGDVVQEACKQPLSEEKIEKQMKKSGEGPLRASQVEVQRKGQVFLPVSSLNELRRKALKAMEDALICQYGLAYERRSAAFWKTSDKAAIKAGEKAGHKDGLAIHTAVRTPGQLEAAIEEGISRIYVDYSLLESFGEKGTGFLSKLADMGKCGDDGETPEMGRTELYLVPPIIVREKDIKYLKKIENLLASGVFAGILIRNLESYSFFQKMLSPEQMILDANLYIWNRESMAFWEGRAAEFYLPVECNGREWRELLQSRDIEMKASVIVYGRLPMMITANCVKKTTVGCNKTPEILTLKDRYSKQFPVYTDCLCCSNIIYNSVPLSLHSLLGSKSRAEGNKGRRFEKERYANLRLDFTLEDKQETLRVIRYFKELLAGGESPSCPIKEYTTGHYKRGVD